MKKFLLLPLALVSSNLLAQVGVNTETPKTTLDVSAKRDSNGTLLDYTETLGLQAPRLSREELTSLTATYGVDQKGALIYITDILAGDAIGQRININDIGYYYFDGLVWQKFTGNSENQEPWNIQGSTNSATNNNQNIYQSGSVAIKKQNSKDGADLDVLGSIRGAGSGRLVIGNSTPDTVGYNSIALGQQTEAEADLSFSIGLGTKTFDTPSGAIGFEASAEAPYSLSIGNNTTASGQGSLAIGYRTIAKSRQETALGRFNSITNGDSYDAYVNTDPLLQIGNGTGPGENSNNAFTILKNGQIGINIPGQNDAAKPDPSAILDVRATDKGFLPPRVLLSNNTFRLNPENINATGLLVFNTGGTNSLAAGYYYWDGTVWQNLKDNSTSSNTDFENIYTNDGELEENRIVSQNDKTLKFTGNSINGFNVGENTISADMQNKRLGINNPTPTNTLDINGDLRIRETEFSNNSLDTPLVIDENGIVKKDLRNKPSNFFRGYSNRNFTSSSASGSVSTILGISPIGINTSYNTTTGIFDVVTTGIYKVTITATLTGSGGNFITGLKNATSNRWITRSTYTSSANTGTGRTFTTVNLVQLSAGDQVAFGLGPLTTILATPSGETGSGIGTFYEIEYLSEGNLE